MNDLETRKRFCRLGDFLQDAHQELYGIIKYCDRKDLEDTLNLISELTTKAYAESKDDNNKFPEPGLTENPIKTKEELFKIYSPSAYIINIITDDPDCSVRTLATKTGLGADVIVSLIEGTISVDDHIAEALAKGIGTSKELWLSLQGSYNRLVAQYTTVEAKSFYTAEEIIEELFDSDFYREFLTNIDSASSVISYKETYAYLDKYPEEWEEAKRLASPYIQRIIWPDEEIEEEFYYDSEMEDYLVALINGEVSDLRFEEYFETVGKPEGSTKDTYNKFERSFPTKDMYLRRKN